MDRKRKLRLTQLSLLILGLVIIFFTYADRQGLNDKQLVSKETQEKVKKQLAQDDEKGDVFFNEKNLNKLKGDKLSEFRNSRIGFIFQFHNLLEEFNVLENVCIPGYVSNSNNMEVEKKGKEILKELDLSDRITHKPNELSGGEQQRVSIARSLINSPDIIFADEPTGNLDSENSKTFIDLIRKLNKKYNQTFVIVTHNKEFLKISDYSYTLKGGEIKLN